MATPENTLLAGDIWHLSIDDLLTSIPETPRLGGPGPFVINLSVSTAPISVPANVFAGCRHARIYQIQRNEDGRTRYRLRLGPFVIEDEADAVLSAVRDIYPSALTATAAPDDLRAIAATRPKSDLPAPPLPAAAALEAPPPAAAASRAPRPAHARPTATAALHAARPATIAITVPAAIPVLSLAAVHSPMASVTAVPGRVERLDKLVADLETTQTVRSLTARELQDDQASRWFVIQLSLSEQAFDPESVPNLDIFGVYRLYSVAGIDQGREMHALRLGFFSDKNAAAAVSSYLSAYYPKAAVKRVSDAERERFVHQRVEPRKDVGATGKHAVIEITDELVVRKSRSADQTPTPTRSNQRPVPRTP